jgi:hypothetical protein
MEEGGLFIEVMLGGVLIQGAPQGVSFSGEILEYGGEGILVGLFLVEMGFGAHEVHVRVLTGGSLVTDGRVTRIFRKEKMRSNNSNDGNYLLLRGILSKLLSSNVL